MSIFLKRVNKLALKRLASSWRIRAAGMSLNMSNCKNLAVFDFDSTIIHDNSDIIVRNLLPKDDVAFYEKAAGGFNPKGWTSYMQGIFELLHNRNIQTSTIADCITKIPPVDGMCQLIMELKDTLNFDVIIISDSNSYFINRWLEQQKLSPYIERVFTNPAEFVDGLLKIQMYHVQEECSLSTVNLCKGRILEDYIESRKNSGLTYSRVIYIGDGMNDFCPMLRLQCNDLACCRAGFSCAKIVQDVTSGKPLKNQYYNIKAEVLMWETGYDILSAVKSSLPTV